MRVDYAIQIVSLVATAVLSPISIDRQAHDRPRVDRVEPEIAKPADVVTAFGANLDRSHVLDLILSGPDSNALTHIVEQRDDSIRFRIPRSPVAGTYSIVLVLANHWKPELVDQQVFITILTD